MSKVPIVEADLHAYVDGQLPSGRRSEVEAYLAAHADDAARVAAYAEQKRALHGLYDAVMDEPVPERLRLPPTPGAGQRWLGWRAAAVVAWMAVGGVIGWSLKPGSAPIAPDTETLARRAAVAHAVYSPEVRHPVEVGADQEQHLVAWLSKRLGGQIKAPVLTEEGYALVGGRLLADEAGPAAQFMYENARGQRLTLYVRRRDAEAGETAFRFAQEGPVGVFYWIDRDFGYALSGAMAREDLQRVAHAVYRQLNE
ncbi:anti-sigma factor family protein [Pelomicrobium methylotrophicum]|uniref:Anti-sigma factor n=1 Tax=Pelomicrobium methylotrophicum TaxID=2602750 RepID=A0A5C7ES31_9PROT|nr:anti-sigma factor [Pelomicrobium methylotrophicum]TXF10611.1 anti-sigma factor [Pelomicrobium methylotrophicum]